MNEKLAYSPKEATEAAAIGKTFLYEAIKSGSLKTRKLGRKDGMAQGAPDMRDTSALAGPLSATVARIYLQRVGIGAKGPMYDAFDVGVDGKPANRLDTRSRSPALDVARIFADLGITGCLEVWHVGGNQPAMFLDTQTAASLTVIDSEQQGPRFAPYRPFDPTQRAGMAIAAHPSELGAASA
jgi:hypothetical protein